MLNLYNSNGLVFWTQEEIKLRRHMEEYFSSCISLNLKTQNAGFEFIQVEAPLITPKPLINKNYDSKDMFILDDEFVMRPETTMGSYAALEFLTSNYNERKVRLPLCVWQHGKSFRREQDQPTKFMRLKEFYQLEFQIAYGLTTKNDYSVLLIPAVQKMIADMIGTCRLEDSDRLPSYAEWTKDVVCEKSNMEVCSISKRKDLPNASVIEVAVGTDRCVYNFINK